MMLFLICNILLYYLYEWMIICGLFIGLFCCDIDVVMGIFCWRDDNYWLLFIESIFYVFCLDYCIKYNVIIKFWVVLLLIYIICCIILVLFI